MTGASKTVALLTMFCLNDTTSRSITSPNRLGSTFPLTRFKYFSHMPPELPNCKPFGCQISVTSQRAAVCQAPKGETGNSRWCDCTPTSKKSIQRGMRSSQTFRDRYSKNNLGVPLVTAEPHTLTKIPHLSLLWDPFPHAKNPSVLHVRGMTAVVCRPSFYYWSICASSGTTVCLLSRELMITVIRQNSPDGLFLSVGAVGNIPGQQCMGYINSATESLFLRQVDPLAVNPFHPFTSTLCHGWP